MNNRGITLIELIIVVSIIAILVLALGFSFQGWMGKYKVESEIKELHVDLMNARARAMQRNRIHFFRVPNTTSYTIYEDDSDGVTKVPDGDSTLQEGTGITADTQLLSFPKTLEYAVAIGNVAGVPPITFSLNSRGIISPETTICIFTDYDGDASNLSDYDPDLDCIVISKTRINAGKLNSQAVGDCDSDHCITK